MKIRIVLFSLVILSAGTAGAGLRLPCLIGSNMVLQRNTDAPLWGWAEPGETVRIRAEWLDDEVTAEADETGKWLARVATPEAGGPYTITIEAGERIVLDNVLIGEVWVASGQSNMQWSLAWSANHEEEIAAADFPALRLISIERRTSFEPVEDCGGSWVPCSPESVANFSAVAYYFGREILRELDVPVGMILSAWGGTPAESWTPGEALNGPEELAPLLGHLEKARKAAGDPEGARKGYQEQVRDWWKASVEEDAAIQEDGWFFKNPDFGAAGWEEMSVPGHWETNGLADFDGCVWYYRAVALPDDWAGKDLLLELGPIDDMDMVWFNGKRAGQILDLGRWAEKRSYTVPAPIVREGTNSVAVRVLDSGGEGGFRGEPDQMRLRPGDELDAEPIPLAGKWKYKVAFDIREMPDYPSRATGRPEHAPTVLYNAMIAPLVPYAIRGAIWYQGESNHNRGYQYRILFPAMIEGWRAAWGLGEFPFYFVQIAPFKYGGNLGAVEVREAQMMALSVPNTGMAITMDIGNPENIHPLNKVDVGKRLALWALAKDYGREKITYSGPLYREMKIEGDTIRLFFDYVDGGLVAKSGPLTHFTIAGKDQLFHEATATIDGETIVVESEKVEDPVAVRYGWSPAAEPNLFNEAGLPASSFRTDDWPGVTVGNR